jgi:hypothetical protein
LWVLIYLHFVGCGKRSFDLVSRYEDWEIIPYPIQNLKNKKFLIAQRKRPSFFKKSPSNLEIWGEMVERWEDVWRIFTSGSARWRKQSALTRASLSTKEETFFFSGDIAIRKNSENRVVFWFLWWCSTWKSESGQFFHIELAKSVLLSLYTRYDGKKPAFSLLGVLPIIDPLSVLCTKRHFDIPNVVPV